MAFVVFVSPYFTEFNVRACEAIAQLPNAQLGVISQEPQEILAPHVRAKLVAHWRIDDALNADQLTWAAQSLAARVGPIHRLCGANEQLQVPVAEARERLGIAGMSVAAAQNFRDKARMKMRLRQAGLPCARHQLVQNESEAWQFAHEVGYPLIVKPPAGAAAQATFRADDADGLRDVLSKSPPAPGRELLVEEFITGDEHSFDSFALDGRVVFHSITHYYPSPLDVLQNAWIQWRVVLPREVDDARYDDIRPCQRAARSTYSAWIRA